MPGSPTPTALVILVALFVAMPIVAFASRRLRIPYTVTLVLVGLAFSALPFRGELGVSPGLVIDTISHSLAFVTSGPATALLGR